MANNETIADIIARKRRLAAEMEKSLGDQHSSVELLKDDADRIEAALKRERGDCAKLREALTKVKEWMERRIVTGGYEFSATLPTMLEDVVLPALAAPARNCDVYTADELKVIFKRELVSELPIANEHEKNLITITAMRVIDTLFATTKEGGNDGNE